MKNILVIEDDINFRHLLCQFLRNNNFQVIEANNIFMGSHLANEQYPDLIVYSLEIVEEIGYQKFQKIHGDSTIFEMPLIFLTKHTDISYSFKKNNQIGAGILLQKTVGFNRILKIIQTELNKKIPDFYVH
ncbi:response regulator [Plectonema cf. radiosum LEGE 06105]|uniref:Response regulator n=1 Tax=Plectonema cf. radiosum LEGE 06105 TaxID=945769 RepID=A0A8J7K1I4_9CYAN|nr:response regulator [Plectonema radiosum]MBE9214681.1 response regulator [Plectonema cf. radiosum LEGE 06105]